MIQPEQSASQEDKRKFPRRHLVFYLRIFDGMSSRVLGHLVDLSERGAMIVSDAPISLNQEYRLRMKLPTEIGGRSELILDSVSRWCHPDTNPDFFVVGFQLSALSAEYEGYIQQLIADFSIEDTMVTQDSKQPACNLRNPVHL